jgi:hypothetical protein
MSHEHVILPTIQLLGIALKTSLIALLLISLLLIPLLLAASIVAKALITST